MDPGPLIGDAVVNDGPGLLLVVQKFRGANTVEVTKGVEEAMAEMAPGLRGIEVDTTIFRPATFIEQSIDNLTRAILLGILLVALIIVAFLFEWRTAFISLIAIPLSLVAALLVLDLAGATVNVMVLAGLVVAVGVVVDDAIIDVENIVRRLRQARAAGSTQSTFGIVLEASVEVRTAITYATIINVVAVVPVLFLEGLSGAFFRPLVLSYGLAVLVSMLVALTVTPALSLLLLSRGKLVARESPVMRGLKRGYQFVIARLIRRPLPALVTAGVMLLVGCARRAHAGQPAAAQLQGTRLLDALADPAGNLGRRGDPDLGIGLPGSAADRRRPQLRLAHRPGVPGRRGLRRRLRRELDQRQPRGRLRRDAGGGPARRSTTTPACTATSRPICASGSRRCSPGRASRSSSGSTAPTSGTLRDQAKSVESLIADIDGVVDAHASFQTDLPHIEVEPNLDAARRHGLTPGDIRRQASTLVASEEVSDIYSGGRAYDVHVTAIPAPATASPTWRTCRWTPRAGRGSSSRTWPTYGWLRPRTRSSANSSRGASTSARTWRVVTWARWSRTSRTGSKA